GLEPGRSAKVRLALPSAAPSVLPVPLWAQPSAQPGSAPEIAPGRRGQREQPARWPPTRREAAHAARPTWPTYGNSLRKTLSDASRKPLDAPHPTVARGCLLGNSGGYVTSPRALLNCPLSYPHGTKDQ